VKDDQFPGILLGEASNYSLLIYFGNWVAVTLKQVGTFDIVCLVKRAAELAVDVDRPAEGADVSFRPHQSADPMAGVAQSGGKVSA
jgi:hypothetical protein